REATATVQIAASRPLRTAQLLVQAFVKRAALDGNCRAACILLLLLRLLLLQPSCPQNGKSGNSGPASPAQLTPVHFSTHPTVGTQNIQDQACLGEEAAPESAGAPVDS